jgi:hypothetical protein
MSRVRQSVALAAAVTALTVAASGCTKGSEDRTPVPAASPAEAAKALQEFVAAYNKAEAAYDAGAIESAADGPYGHSRSASLRSSKVLKPGGNPAYKPLELTDAKFAIPKNTGWPRWFLADTDTNRDENTEHAARRVALVFNKQGADKPWKVTYVLTLEPGTMPELRKDADGNAEAVPLDASDLSLAPGQLSKRYAQYLTDGVPNGFAPGTDTTGRRAVRARDAYRPGYTTQWLDQPADSGTWAPVALRTADGRAMAFFASRTFQQMKLDKADRDAQIPISPAVKAIMTGSFSDTLIREKISVGLVVVPPATDPEARITFLGRTSQIVAAKGS